MAEKGDRQASVIVESGGIYSYVLSALRNANGQLTTSKT